MSNVLADSVESDLTTPDGRVLHVYEAGDSSGTLVISHHGTPGAGLITRSWHDSAVARGIRLIGYDRPGYGRSKRHAGRRVADAAADTAAIADQVGAGRFATWGVSGGGPHALACAALLGDRVFAAATIASAAPADGDGLDFLAGMGEDNVIEFGAAAEGEVPLRAFLDEARQEMLAATPEQLTGLLESLLPEVDKAVLHGEVADYLHVTMIGGLGESDDGWFDDDMAFVSDWGFALDDIAIPVLLLQGEQDLFVPLAHGRWLAQRIRGVDARLSAQDGHLSLFARIDDVHAWLLAQG
jgi:pimeloyl-ACP methyl ester carboxylesterase